jgi:hypothetical protein
MMCCSLKNAGAVLSIYIPRKKEEALMNQATALGLVTAVLLGIQGIIVGSIIQPMDSQPGPAWTRGIYIVRKNLYILQLPENSKPKCSLPALHNTSSAGGLLALSLEGTGIQVSSSNFYQFLDTYAVPHSFEVGFIDVRYLICAFFFLSFLFQMLQVAGADGRLRFVEYSLSASLMILAIAVQVGITDIYILCCMFALIFATNVLGLMAELLMALKTPWLWLLPHCLAWVTCLVAYAPLLDAYLSSMYCSDRSPPGYAHVIVFLQFALFSCFGCLQLYSLYNRTLALQLDWYHNNPNIDETSFFFLETDGSDKGMDTSRDWEEMAYTMLSFTAKTLLAWLVLAPTIVHPDQMFA